MIREASKTIGKYKGIHNNSALNNTKRLQVPYFVESNKILSPRFRAVLPTVVVYCLNNCSSVQGLGSDISCKNNTEYEPAPQFTNETLVKTIILSVMTLLSFVGNSATVISIRRQKLNRSTVHKLIFHMAIADLFVTFACLCMEAVWTYTVKWLAGNFLCKLMKYLQVSQHVCWKNVSLYGHNKFIHSFNNHDLKNGRYRANFCQ